MDKTWVLVADKSRGRLLCQTPAIPLQELEAFSHPAARSAERDLVSSKQGRSFDSKGGRHAMEPPTRARDHEAEVFARQLAEKLDHAAASDGFDELVLIAPPEFLGMLRNSLGDGAHKRITSTTPKNLTLADISTIARHLQTNG